MAGIDSISQGNKSLLRLSYAVEDQAQSARPETREQQLARTLEDRLDNRLDRIRARLESNQATAPSISNSTGAGRRLDILA